MAKKLLITLGGRIGALEEKKTKGGESFFSGRMVTSKSYKDAQGNWQSKENWFNFTAFDKASVAYLKKAAVGDKIILTADLEDKQHEGVTYYNLNVLSIISITPKEQAKHLSDVNNVFVIGKKCSDYELKNSFVNGSIGVTKRIKSGDDFTNDTQWVRISAAGKVAEKLVSEKKGDVLHLEGELTASEYTNKDGKAVKTVSVFVTSVKGHVTYEVSEGASEGTGQTGQQTTNSVADADADFMNVQSGSIDEIPFEFGKTA